MQIVSGQLSREECLQAIAQIIQFLKAHGTADVLVAYGFDCNCKDEDLFKEVQMPLDDLSSYISKSETAGFYHVSKNELHVKDINSQFKLTICHESDIHFTSKDVALVNDLRALWQTSNFTVHER